MHVSLNGALSSMTLPQVSVVPKTSCQLWMDVATTSVCLVASYTRRSTSRSERAWPRLRSKVELYCTPTALVCTSQAHNPMFADQTFPKEVRYVVYLLTAPMFVSDPPNCGFSHVFLATSVVQSAV